MTAGGAERAITRDPDGPGRARRPTGSGFKPAATAEEGTGPGAPPGRGTPRGRGSNRQQPQRKGRGRASRPGAAPRGVGVQAGGEGVGRGGGGGGVGGSRAAGRREGEGGGGGVSASPWCRGPADRRPPNPLTWVNTEGEGEGERPAHRHVAAATWGRASRGRSALSGL